MNTPEQSIDFLLDTVTQKMRETLALNMTDCARVLQLAAGCPSFPMGREKVAGLFEEIPTAFRREKILACQTPEELYRLTMSALASMALAVTFGHVASMAAEGRAMVAPIDVLDGLDLGSVFSKAGMGVAK